MTPEIWDGLVVNAEFKGPLAGRPLAEANQRVRSGQTDRWQADVEIRTRTGETRWVMDLSTVLSDASGHCYGCLGILQDITDRKLAEKELMRTSAALHQQNRELEADLALAAELQAALMPSETRSFPGHVPAEQGALRFHRLYQPTAAVGGDFFDVLALSDTKAGVFICDVMGHGVRSALVAGMIRALMEHLSAEAEHPGLFLARVNQALHAILTRARQPMFATAFYLVADVLSGEVRYANAGHPSPLRVRGRGGADWVCPAGERRYGALVMVDDSHAVGFMGRHGAGTHEHHHVMGRIDILTGTLGKALGGASGGYTSGRKEIVEILRQRSRPYLFSNTIAPPIAAGSIRALDLLRESTALRDKLEANTRFFREGLTKLGFNIIPGEHPIVPIMIGDAALAGRVAEAMLARGVYVIGFFYPVVPKGKARIRTQVSAAHSEEELAFAIDTFEAVRKDLAI